MNTYIAESEVGKPLCFTAAFAKLPGKSNRASGWLSVKPDSLTFEGLRGSGRITVSLSSDTLVTDNSVFGLVNYGFVVRTSNGDKYTFEPLDTSGSIRNVAGLVRSLVEHACQTQAVGDWGFIEAAQSA